MGNKRYKIPKEQSKMDNSEKPSTQGTHARREVKQKQHNICSTPLYANKHK
jgi:hypothetical protein